MPPISFYNLHPPPQKKPTGFLIISGVIERDQWHEIDCIQTLLMRFWCPKIINLVRKQSFPKKLTFSKNGYAHISAGYAHISWGKNC